MRITKPRNWHLYSEEMKNLWWKTEYPKIVEANKRSGQEFKKYLKDIKSGKIKR